jgi:replicative DNA helicase
MMLENTKAVKLEAERAVIGSVLIQPECLGELLDVEPEDFYYHSHQELWKVCRYLYEVDEPLDLPTITSAIKDADKIDEVGGPTFLIELASSTPTAANARYYANIVKKAATLRRALKTVDRLSDRLAEVSAEEVDKALDEAAQAIEEARPDASKGLKHISEIEDKVFETLDKKTEGIKTGLKIFDDFSGGLQPGWLYVLAGRPSVGKTAKMLQMAGGVARRGQGAVLIWSQEMDDVEILLRILSNETGVPYNFLTKDRDKLEEKHRKKLRDRYKELRELPIYINDASGVSIHEIQAAIKHFKARKGKIAAVFVDYLQIMDIRTKPGETRAQAIGNVAQTAKDIARKEKLCFVLLSQLSRKTEDEGGKPQLGHLKDSGGIEQAADVVEFLYEHKNDLENEAEIGTKWVRSMIAKGRNIGTVEIKCCFAGWCQRYDEIRIVPPGEDEKKAKENKHKGAA